MVELGGDRMANSILLAAHIFQEKQNVNMAFYCNIEGVKEGYMFINLGNVAQDVAFWKGLDKVLTPLVGKYQDYHLMFAFSRLFMDLQGRQEKRSATFKVSRFQSVEHVDYEEFEEPLALINRLGKIDGHPLNQLCGYSKEEIKVRELDLASNKKKEESSKKKPKNNYYDGFGMPEYGAVIDFESTSTIVEHARIIEISALLFRDGEVIEEYHTFVNPGIKLPKQIRELTGITEEDVKDAPRGIQAVKGLLSFIKNADVIVAHNAFYDYNLLQDFCRRFKLNCWEGQLLCTKRLAKEMQVEVSDYKLESLCALFNIENKQAHRANSDTRATFKLLKHLYSTSLF